ncbi:hypothetical protein HUB98_09275 [Paenibacillus barcinonensis]|uniref:Uncharacterized protein n=1 Tax=Paenibacillus barcinonensis TaxID=198119 RepID=A0A2V4VT63_PAEBA|nr:hypothetical protein [Paenibacillus barcinonensis]PYE49809.1 hypothetical protein DFQ00_105313 [Paenibacillus barcinonensis]QKS56513.1 hypothetical protein HUB98_09275 [Paenibacillus barcinonensis]
MTREQLAAEALQAGKHSLHNLQLIQSEPERMLPGRMENAEDYLNRMIRFAEAEMKNARLAGRTLGLRTRLKSLLLQILHSPEQKRKGESV